MVQLPTPNAALLCVVASDVPRGACWRVAVEPGVDECCRALRPTATVHLARQVAQDDTASQAPRNVLHFPHSLRMAGCTRRCLPRRAGAAVADAGTSRPGFTMPAARRRDSCPLRRAAVIRSRARWPCATAARSSDPCFTPRTPLALPPGAAPEPMEMRMLGAALPMEAASNTPPPERAAAVRDFPLAARLRLTTSLGVLAVTLRPLALPCLEGVPAACRALGVFFFSFAFLSATACALALRAAAASAAGRGLPFFPPVLPPAWKGALSRPLLAVFLDTALSLAGALPRRCGQGGVRGLPCCRSAPRRLRHAPWTRLPHAASWPWLLCSEQRSCPSQTRCPSPVPESGACVPSAPVA